GVVTGAETEGEGQRQQAEHEGEQVLVYAGQEQRRALRHGEDLQREQGEDAQQQDQRRQTARQRAAKAKGEEVGHRAQLIGTGDAQDGLQEYGCEQEGQGVAEVVREVAIAAVGGGQD